MKGFSHRGLCCQVVELLRVHGMDMADRRGSRATTGHGAGETERYEKLYAMLLDAIPSSVLLIDPQLHVVSANRNFLEKARRTESDTIGQRIDAVFPHPAIPS